MSSLIFSEAKKIRRLAKNARNKWLDVNPSDTEFADNVYNHTIESQRYEFRETLKIAKLLHEDYIEATGLQTTNWYFITIRPKPGVTFEKFYETVYKYVSRKCMQEFTLTFEQKSEVGSGDGFHTHIVAYTSHRSKPECLRDTLSTFNKICEPQCIEVKTTREPNKIINDYLIDYKSVDNHKEATKIGDQIWRTNMNLKNIYKCKEDLHHPSSPGQVVKDNTISVNFN